MQPTNTSLDTLTRPSHEMTNDDNSQLPPRQNPPAYTPPKERKQEDWEDWEDDDDIVTPIDAGEQVNPPPATITITPPRTNSRASKRTSKQPVPRSSKHATGRIKRKSRQRQKAQNAQAGIKLITDMSAFRRPNAVAQQLKTPDGRPIKFVDAAALRALEGEPNSASVGNWNWLKRNKNQSPVAQPPAPEILVNQSPAPQTQATQSPRQPQQQLQQPTRTPEPVSPRLPINGTDHVLSPQDRPIVIGITLDSSEYDNRDFSPTPTTALDLETPVNPPPSRSPANAKTPPLTTTPDPAPQKSVWSPDTPDTAFSFNSGRIPSTISSQVQPQSTGSSEKVPPVPALPGTYKKLPHRRLVSLEGGNDDDDTGTPCTLFEEDGITSPLKQPKGKHPVLTPESANSNNGWWDHVVTPFMDKRLSFAARKPKLDSPREEDKEDEWWIGADAKRSDATPMTTLPPAQYLTPKASPVSFQTPIVRAPTPRRSPSPRVGTSAALESGPSTARSSPVPETFSVRDSLRDTSSVPDTASIHEAYSVPQASPTREKPRIILTPEIPAEQPPPYSPPKKKTLVAARYGGDFHTGHSSRSQYAPSSGSEAPGLFATMTSQGNNHLTDVPITPAGIQTRSPLSQLALPDRPVGTYLPPEHAREARGEENRVERQRRRHEKEDVVARKAGGFWRGRGCVPKGGCYGRTGREGRKKRRRCCMFFCCIFIVLAILAIVLGVVLTRPKHSKEVPSIWVNLTDYPPMPTGVLSMVGSDNTVSRSGCTEPSTLWSCSLPKEQHDSVAPYTHNQPTIIMNIQWDNDTRNPWKVPNGDAPEGVSRRSPSGAVLAGETIQKRQISFTPSPSAPEFQEMWFLGNTTDGIQSDEKGGEPTPFYISVVDSLNASGTVLGKREDDSSNISLPSLLPSPDTNQDGTPKPAVLIPRPVQQPVRLYDRGLPTEHYGFYSYFKRTIFLRSVTVVNATDENDIPLDENGGCRATEADFIVTWSETRFLVRIWTKALDNKSSLLSSSGQPSINGTAALVRPGTMPYPVTVTIDTHGGEPLKKFVWNWPIDKRQQVDVKSPKLLSNDIGFAGTWINRRSTGSAKFGGYDGGTGGCKCEWANWV